MESRAKLTEQKKSQKRTGGGKPTADPSPAQQKILDLCEETPGFKGLEGVESPACSSTAAASVPLDSSGSGDDDRGLSNATIVPAVHATVSSGSSETRPSKVLRNAAYEDLINIERANALIKQENLKLKQNKLKLEIELLEHKLNAST